MNLAPFVSAAIEQVLKTVGITGDDAVAIIDAFKSKKVVLGYLRESTPSDDRYVVVIGTSAGPVRAIIQRDPHNGNLSIVRSS